MYPILINGCSRKLYYNLLSDFSDFISYRNFNVYPYLSMSSEKTNAIF